MKRNSHWHWTQINYHTLYDLQPLWVLWIWCIFEVVTWLDFNKLFFGRDKSKSKNVKRFKQYLATVTTIICSRYQKAGTPFPRARYASLKKNIRSVSKKLSALAQILNPVRNLSERDRRQLTKWLLGNMGFRSRVNVAEKNILSFLVKLKALLRKDKSSSGRRLQWRTNSRFHVPIKSYLLELKETIEKIIDIIWN